MECRPVYIRIIDYRKDAVVARGMPNTQRHPSYIESWWRKGCPNRLEPPVTLRIGGLGGCKVMAQIDSPQLHWKPVAPI